MNAADLQSPGQFGARPHPRKYGTFPVLNCEHVLSLTLSLYDMLFAWPASQCIAFYLRLIPRQACCKKKPHPKQLQEAQRGGNVYKVMCPSQKVCTSSNYTVFLRIIKGVHTSSTNRWIQKHVASKKLDCTTSVIHGPSTNL